MIVYPAIDILGGKAVRMRAGDYATAYEVAPSPMEAAKRWVNEGAEWLHVVDLDGARTGTPANLDIVRALCRRFTVPIQAGGGIRDYDTAERFIETGVSRIIVGTAVLEEPDLIVRLVDRFADRLAIAVDAKDGYVVEKGWTVVTKTKAIDLVHRLSIEGVATVVFTNVSVDGTLQGVDLPSLDAVGRSFNGDVIYSGGIGKIDDIRAITRYRHRLVKGVIVGRALYGGEFTLQDAIAAAKSKA